MKVKKIENYLLKLDDQKYLRLGSDNIRVYDLGDTIGEIYRGLREFKSVEEIENKIKTHQTFSNWILNKTGIAIMDLYELCLYWKETCDKSGEEFDKLWQEFFYKVRHFGSTNGKKFVLPKVLDFRLAYLLGVILGDGHLADPNKSYDKLTSYNSEVRITYQNEETFIFLKHIFKDLFDYSPTIYSETSKTGKLFYRFVIKCKPLHRFLLVVCGVPVGDKRGKVRVPEIVKNSSLYLQKWFIAGFFDSDGCISFDKKGRPIISITQYDSPILKEILDISLKFGVNWKGPYEYKYKYNNCGIKIYRRKDIKRFLNIIPSLNPNKLINRGRLWQKLKDLNT